MTIPKLNHVRVAGFRSLRDVSLDLTPVTVLIGPNGAGKSNILWALEMARMIAFESLQLFVGERGGATYLMHYGPQTTAAIDLELEFTTDAGQNAYSARLGYAANESLVFLWEKAGFRREASDAWRWSELGAGHQESKLREAADTDPTARTVRWLLRQINFYHFHDTSRRSALRTRDFADAGSDYLRSNGSNLASFLDGLRSSEDPGSKAAWRLMQGTIRRVAPCIAEVVPKHDKSGVRLEWIDDMGKTFGPAHLSDGTLRAITMITALVQPSSCRPLFIAIDEPELSLHPSAISLVAGLIASVSVDYQVLIATQSPGLLDHFEPKDVIVVERHGGETGFKRLVPAELDMWLEDYSLSELYDKNVLGGRP